MNNTKNIYLLSILLLVVVYFPLFSHLDSLPLRIWDESRNALNAYEMHLNGNYLVTHFGNTPDMWNTKPPLLIWSQVLFIKTIGVSELAIRLPSAIAAFLTCVSIFVFSIKYLKDPWYGLISIIILVTSHGYISLHGTRTGDFDSMLTLFTTLYLLLFFLFSESKKRKFLYLFFIALSLAVLTKGVAGLIFIPVLVIYTITQKQFKFIITNKHFYIGLFTFLLTVIGYYIIRDIYNPGFLSAVVQNELGGRYLTVQDKHQHGVWYYLIELVDSRFSYWFILIPIGFFVGITSKNFKFQRFSFYIFLSIITFLLVISFTQTKLKWYDLPLYPLLSLIAAIGIKRISEVVVNQLETKSWLPNWIIQYAFLFILFIQPYVSVFDKTFLPKENPKDMGFYDIGHLFQDALDNKCELNDLSFVHYGYNAHNLFYIKWLESKGTNIYLKDWKTLTVSEKAIIYQPLVKKFINEKYTTNVLKQYGTVDIIEVTGAKH